MNVAELIAALQQLDPRAIVVLWDHDAKPGPGVSRLRESAIQSLYLTSWESNGMLMYEVFEEGRDGLAQPGVVLGSS